MKRFLSLFVTAVMCLSFISTQEAYASENTTMSLQEFNRLQQEGYIDEKISYEYMLEFIEENNKLEKSLDENENFNKVYDIKPRQYFPLDNGGSSILLLPGDVLVTNSTPVYGIIGHAAIVIGYDEVLDIPGLGKKVRTQSVSSFIDTYDDWGSWIKVYRPVNSNWGYEAAAWAERTYKGSDAEYSFNLDLSRTDKTYCSKIVYQAYKYGVGVSSFKNLREYYYRVYGLISPYSLPSLLNVSFVNKL